MANGSAAQKKEEVFNGMGEALRKAASMKKKLSTDELRAKIAERMSAKPEGGEVSMSDIYLILEAEARMEELEGERQAVRETEDEEIIGLFNETAGKELDRASEELDAFRRAQAKTKGFWPAYAAARKKAALAAKLEGELAGAENAQAGAQAKVLERVAGDAAAQGIFLEVPADTPDAAVWDDTGYVIADDRLAPRHFFDTFREMAEACRRLRDDELMEERKKLVDAGLLVTPNAFRGLKRDSGTGSLTELMDGKAERAVLVVRFGADRLAEFVVGGDSVLCTADENAAKAIFSEAKPVKFGFNQKTRAFFGTSDAVFEALSVRLKNEGNNAWDRARIDQILASATITTEELLDGHEGLCPFLVHWKRDNSRRYATLAFLIEGDGKGSVKLTHPTRETVRTVGKFVERFGGRERRLDDLKRNSKFREIVDRNEVAEEVISRELAETCEWLGNEDAIRRLIDGKVGNYLLDIRNRDGERYVARLTVSRGKVSAYPVGEIKKYEKVPIKEIPEGWLRWALRSTCRRVLGENPEIFAKPDPA